MKLSKRYKIKKTLQETKSRRSSMVCKVIECKVDKSTLSNLTINTIRRIFIEGKWLYNSILSSKDINSYDTKITSVPVKILNKFENRELLNISSQMKQGIKSRIFSSIMALKSLKEMGYGVGKLKFKSEIKSIPLKQHKNTFTILRHSNRIKIQGIKKPLKVNGLNQLPKNYEIGNANLVSVGDDTYIKITIFTPKEKIDVPDKSIGIDFGCTTQLTLSNGEKIEYQVPISNKIKRLDKSISRKIKCSKNREKVLLKREKAYKNLTNKRKEIKNQIVNRLVKKYKTIVFQDESIKSWQENGHGKKIQYSAMGGIISALKRKAVTPIVVEKYYPSTQLCNKCGSKQKMKQNERIYLCKSCGARFDRDINAAINIEKEGLRIKQTQKIPMEYREFKPVETRSNTLGLEIDSKQVQSTKQEAITPLVFKQFIWE